MLRRVSDRFAIKRRRLSRGGKAAAPEEIRTVEVDVTIVEADGETNDTSMEEDQSGCRDSDEAARSAPPTTVVDTADTTTTCTPMMIKTDTKTESEDEGDSELETVREVALMSLLAAAELRVADLSDELEIARIRIAVLTNEKRDERARAAALVHDLGVLSAETATLRRAAREHADAVADAKLAGMAEADRLRCDAKKTDAIVARLTGAVVLAAHVLADTEARGMLELELAAAGVDPVEIAHVRHSDPTAFDTDLREQFVTAARAAFEGNLSALAPCLAGIPTAATAIELGKELEAALGEDAYALLYPEHAAPQRGARER